MKIKQTARPITHVQTHEGAIVAEWPAEEWRDEVKTLVKEHGRVDHELLTRLEIVETNALTAAEYTRMKPILTEAKVCRPNMPLIQRALSQVSERAGVPPHELVVNMVHGGMTFYHSPDRTLDPRTSLPIACVTEHLHSDGSVFLSWFENGQISDVRTEQLRP